MNKWVLGARPRTLPVSVAPVLVGTACAHAAGEIVWWRAGAALVTSLAIQIGTNYVNDFADGERGTDDNRVGPTRLVASGLATARQVKVAALVCGLVAGLAGLSLALAVGPELLVVGAASLAAGYFYTGGPKPYGYLGLGELFVFVFFGLVATAGSAYIHLDRLTGLSVAAAVPIGFLATAILVANNLRDIPTDTVAGKHTLAVRVGDGRTRSLYVALVAGAFLGAIALTASRWGALAVLLAVPLAVPLVKVVRSGAVGRALIPVLGGTGKLQMVFGLLLAVGLFVG
ncbi:MAG: 1,4-dihydroxy-2-naphthoate polyprenyltransferase [Acidimicrobiia bacterium]